MNEEWCIVFVGDTFFRECCKCLCGYFHYTALKTLIDTVSTYKEADYQAAAFKNLTDKLNAAKTAYGKADATVEELEAAKTALEEAKKQADSNKAVIMPEPTPTRNP